MFEESDSRRASPRVKCGWNVKCVTEQKKVFTARALDVSQGGIQVTSPVAFKKGDRLYLEIAGYMSGKNHVIKVVGLVVYISVSTTNEIQIGLKYISNLALQDSKFLQQYVKAMLGG